MKNLVTVAALVVMIFGAMTPHVEAQATVDTQNYQVTVGILNANATFWNAELGTVRQTIGPIEANVGYIILSPNQNVVSTCTLVNPATTINYCESDTFAMITGGQGYGVFYLPLSLIKNDRLTYGDTGLTIRLSYAYSFAIMKRLAVALNRPIPQGLPNQERLLYCMTGVSLFGQGLVGSDVNKAALDMYDFGGIFNSPVEALGQGMINRELWGWPFTGCIEQYWPS